MVHYNYCYNQPGGMWQLCCILKFLCWQLDAWCPCPHVHTRAVSTVSTGHQMNVNRVCSVLHYNNLINGKLFHAKRTGKSNKYQTDRTFIVHYHSIWFRFTPRKKCYWIKYFIILGGTAYFPCCVHLTTSEKIARFMM